MHVFKPKTAQPWWRLGLRQPLIFEIDCSKPENQPLSFKIVFHDKVKTVQK